MLIGLPLFMLAHFVGNQFHQGPFNGELLLKVGLNFLLALLLWLTIRGLMDAFRWKFPGYEDTIKRVAWTIVVSAIIGIFLNTLLFDFYGIIVGKVPITPAVFMRHLGPMLFFSALVVGGHEVIYSFYELRRIDKEKEELKKAHLQSQLDSLKSQVNPHFLFNSLSSLQSLIATSPERAEQFVEELSTVYRYLLQSNQDELVTLRQELTFINSYFHLLKTRYGTGIQLNIRVEEMALDYLLPSLTLQLLLENAVKHNVISPRRPLIIEFTTHHVVGEMMQMQVSNNLQRKVQTVASSQMGLNNIMTKFRLLNQPDIAVTDSDGFFTIIFPLIKANKS
ncbi:histidine kinase [Telluribacter humicola]